MREAGCLHPTPCQAGAVRGGRLSDEGEGCEQGGAVRTAWRLVIWHGGMAARVFTAWLGGPPCEALGLRPADAAFEVATPQGRERRGSPTLQALQDPILLLHLGCIWRLSKP